MKRFSAVLWISMALILSSAALAGGKWRGPRLQISTLDSNEQERLVFLREEEKLARDVYREMYASWGRMVFANIAESEQQHMDAVAKLLAKYSIPDPIVDESTGEFQDDDLARLYKQLIDNGFASVIDALKVGAYIEEIDILDLEAGIAETDNADIQKVYGNLLNGSQNHLRAFVRNLEALGVIYSPEELSTQDFEAIIFGY